VLHVQHFNLLSYCRELAGINGKLIVAIDSDQKILKDTNKKPIFSTTERLNALLALKYLNAPMVNSVLIFYSNDELYSLIKCLNPNIIVKGSEWSGNVIGSDICKVNYFSYDNSYSSTGIVKRIKEA
jgi:bifunctional ADP-heptose synthase (sugar kinase/adenylyltransferase)